MTRGYAPRLTTGLSRGVVTRMWSLVILALIAPELITTAQTLWRIRSAKARHARTAGQEQLALAE